MYRCHACGKEIEAAAKVGRRDECPFCRKDLHCCLNCSLFDPSAAKQCREPVAEYVPKKERANFCDYFVFRQIKDRSTTDAEKAKKALEDLFRKQAQGT